MDFQSAAEAIARRDPAFRRFVDMIGPPALRPPMDGYFLAIARSIAFQQLAGRAAAAIFGRFLANFPDGITPEAVAALPEERFRAAGMSGNKTACLSDLAAKVLDRTVPLDGIEAFSDDEIVERLTQVHGIGRWTAEMFLIFQLRRPDVWPVDDFAVRKGYGVVHGLAEAPKPKALIALGEAYRPWRTVATWYCWRATDTVLPEA